ncbi:MAG: protein kinase domain-containing protein [Eubacteriales bacterium]
MNESLEESSVCSYCNYDNDTGVESPLYIKPGSVINNYLFGKVLGQGGFGITYIGYDTKEECKVAIKEFLPTELATRHSETHDITVFSGEKVNSFKTGIEKFKKEAELLKEFSDFPGIVDGYDVFEANNTAYFVMEYIEGITLKDYIAQKGGRLPLEAARNILVPIFDALTEMHRKNIIHRDISPDNIYITKEKQVKLLDFGAARQAMADQQKSLSVVLKQGFTPKEQYFSKGKQGPWTDVYALGATTYYMLTGTIPQPALDRLENDNLVPLTSYDYDISLEVDAIIKKALSLDETNRYKSVEEYKSALLYGDKSLTSSQQEQANKSIETKTEYKSSSEENVNNEQKVSKQKKVNKQIKMGALIGIPVVLLMVVLSYIIFTNKIPDLSKLNAEEAIALLEDKGLEHDIDYVIDEKVSAGNIVKQSPRGNKRTFGKEVEVIISKGPSDVVVPNIIGLEEEEAVNELEKFGFEINLNHIHHLEDEGIVFEIDQEVGKTLKNGSKIEVSISEGHDPNWVYFEDPNFEKAIIEELELDIDLTREMISKEDIVNIKRLYIISDETIYNIEGIQEFEALESFHCSFEEISDISQLAELEKLKELEVAGNNINELPELSRKIEEISIGFNNIGNIDLSRYYNLAFFSGSGNNFTELPKLPTSIEGLYISDNRITSIEGIEKLTNLKYLDLEDNKISDFEPLDSIYSNLKDCNTDGNKVNYGYNSDTSPDAEWSDDINETYERNGTIKSLYPNDYERYLDILNNDIDVVSDDPDVVYLGETDGFDSYMFEDDELDVTIIFLFDTITDELITYYLNGLNYSLFGDFDLNVDKSTYKDVIDVFGEPTYLEEAGEGILLTYITSEMGYSFWCIPETGEVDFLQIMNINYLLEDSLF